MNKVRIGQVVIVGGGVAGSTLAIYLARAGRDVLIVDRPLKLDLLVGESLLPPATTILQDLGIEEQVKACSTLKQGVAFVMRTGRVLLLNLQRLTGLSASYAYNVPRPQFDQLLRTRAQEVGVRVVQHAARLRVEGGRVELDAETLEACGLKGQPDLVIDATGRARMFGRAMELPGVAGKRNDTCHFAHYENVDLGVSLSGCAVITAMKTGWAWRIPLPDRMSVGVVQDTAHLTAYGSTPEERLENALRDDPIMAAALREGRRLTSVRVYNNYQWRYERFRGPNWILVGDAAGFVDPTLSSGVLLSLQGASGLAQALTADDVSSALTRWEATYRENIATWQELVDSFYDGRLFAMIMQGEDFARNNEMLGPFNRHMERNVAGAVLGARTTHWYGKRLVRMIINHGLVRYQPGEWAIR
ncbi:tryptophan halogenase [Myxococcus stipitatus DSM 14675]|uniref:Tryptophan halogenase n=1 Tax=Myxococcus stipitatus (strain DSM 14675 / JCM 12634 / Mx s8) TaxID=1278073 RepID=L7UDF1_MYXSD|nr:tryptophan 7-halogenase [Myxococcus stipitatus]AGC46083.1 tryptophan halogenase [Myxococcus stipitatus DSM 14675]